MGANIRNQGCIQFELTIKQPLICSSYTTTISYTSPEKFKKAQIVITGKSGNILRQVNLFKAVKATLHVDASTLSSGAYNYAL